ncbi:hypothetical protein BU24DRAFT_421407 [Aaosphaeria arxii CBS 175.79]|uniref:Uncharacterized protein n=1 Tax=Aaosphaeria arxii CBS 175.79 TaxID=1450172 RepID=A0A6A5XYP5_9PLEO|nr:uncharacterized protein BU24DRAFT_421407 [Aaosphaeria arxii CBS 175.79]KAF2018418.1 hypothetical protein BU24DRAFT_421407 [Aaosphaeria arxii CBS 175.79]
MQCRSHKCLMAFRSHWQEIGSPLGLILLIMANSQSDVNELSTPFTVAGGSCDKTGEDRHNAMVEKRTVVGIQRRWRCS